MNVTAFFSTKFGTKEQERIYVDAPMSRKTFGQNGFGRFDENIFSSLEVAKGTLCHCIEVPGNHDVVPAVKRFDAKNITINGHGLFPLHDFNLQKYKVIS